MFGGFFDVTSLYGRTMQQLLSCGNHKWPNDLTIENILSADCFGGVGYFIKVDLEYFPHMREHHNDLELAYKKLQIKSEWLSDYAKSFGIPAPQVAKLVETLSDNYFHVCRIRILRLYVKRG